jgi:putative transposase
MPRIARVVATGFPHHITQRGNHQQDIFLSDNDRKLYLTLVQEYSTKHDLTIYSYCLMNNHVHFIALPNQDDSLAKTFRAAHMLYAQYFNKTYKVNGHLWQGRYFSCVLDQHHLIAATRYVERNPVHANLVKLPWEWKWSSASIHIETATTNYFQLMDLFKVINMTPDAWCEFIASAEDIDKIKDIKKHTMAGKPLGNEFFIEQLEKKLNRKLITQVRGRPSTNKPK